MIVCSNAPRVIAPVRGSWRLEAISRSPSATSRRCEVSHDSSRVSRTAIALRSVRSAAVNRRPESATIATSPATSLGADRSASAISDRGLGPLMITVPLAAAAMRAA